LSSVDERVAYVSGFTGSNATVLITQDEALIWTDGRYYLQAEKELNEYWTIMKLEKNEITLSQYIEEIVYKKVKKNDNSKKTTIGIDTKFITHGINFLKLK
jgi:Xaa-Pro aminopeptidase